MWILTVSNKITLFFLKVFKKVPCIRGRCENSGTVEPYALFNQRPAINPPGTKSLIELFGDQDLASLNYDVSVDSNHLIRLINLCMENEKENMSSPLKKYSKSSKILADAHQNQQTGCNYNLIKNNENVELLDQKQSLKEKIEELQNVLKEDVEKVAELKKKKKTNETAKEMKRLLNRINRFSGKIKKCKAQLKIH